MHGNESTRVVLAQGARPPAVVRPPLGLRQRRRVASKASPRAGDVVSLADHDGRFIGRGFYNPRSQIPLRLCTRADEAVDAAFLRARIARARAAARPAGPAVRPTPTSTAWSTARATTCPGWWSTSTATPRSCRSRRWASPSAAPTSSTRSRPSWASRTIFEIAPAAYADLEGFAGAARASRAARRAPASPVIEDGIRLEVEPLSGQKTGMFIDQRETRARVGGAGARRARARLLRLRGRLRRWPAARGGASAVTAVDSSARAVARIEAHAAANGVTIEAVEADAFRYLETATPRSFDLVVIDPPKFARARKDLEAARKGYERLNALALQAVRARAASWSPARARRTSTPRPSSASSPPAPSRRAARCASSSAAAPPPTTCCPPASPKGQYLKVLLCYVA